jgi:hypothetical protein
LEATHDDVRFAVERRLVGLSMRSFPRPFTIYAGNVEDVSLGGRRFRAGVNKCGKTEPETGRRGAEVAWNPVGLGGPTAVGSNGETNGDAKFSKDYADAKDDAVNQRAPKSMEGKELAPQVGLEPTTLRLTAQVRPKTTVIQIDLYCSTKQG